MTKNAERVLMFIRDFRLLHGYSPSLREISDGCACGGLAGAKRYVTILCRAGLLTRHGQVRGCIPTDAAPRGALGAVL